MSSDPVASAAPSDGPPSESDYDAVYAALSATARGRRFLAEYARRSRTEDVRIVLSALARIAASMPASASPLGDPAASDGTGASANQTQTDSAVPRPRWYMEVPDFVIVAKNSAADEPSTAQSPGIRASAGWKEDPADLFEIVMNSV